MDTLKNGFRRSLVLTQPIRKELIMSKNDFNDLKTTSQNLENLLTVFYGLAQYHQLSDDFHSLYEKLNDEVSDLQLSIGLLTSVPDFAIEKGLLRGLPLNAKHKPTQELN